MPNLANPVVKKELKGCSRYPVRWNKKSLDLINSLIFAIGLG